MTAQRIPHVKHCCQQDDFERSLKVFDRVLLTILKNYGELLDQSSFSDSDRMFVQGLRSGTLLEKLWPFYGQLDFFIYLIIRQNSRIAMLSTLIFSYLILALAASTFSWEKLCIFRIDLSLYFILGGLLSSKVNKLFIVVSKHLFVTVLTLFMLLELKQETM